MDDATLQSRLWMLPEARFEEVVGVCVPAVERDAVLGEARSRMGRATALAGYARHAPALREKLVAHLREDPVADWVGLELRRHGEVAVLGYGVNVKLPLDEVFVQLAVDLGLREREPTSRIEEALESHGPRYYAPAEALVEAVKARRRGVALIGPPGTGKTTLLQHLFTRVATGDAASVGMPADTVPVLLRFSRIAAAWHRDLRLRDVVVAAAARESPHAADALRGDGGRWLLLLDGLDEVRDEATREALSRWLDDELVRLPDARFVATCRNEAWKRAARLGEKFLRCDVLLLDDEGVDAYVTRWFRAVERWNAGAGEAAAPAAEARGRERAEALLKVLRDPERASRLRLDRLMYSPLLLSTLCLVHDKKSELPRQRFELYRECLKLLLDGATKPRGDSARPAEEPCRLVLEAVAWEMHHDNVDDVAVADFEPRVARAMTGVQGLGLPPAAFVAYARDDCGVLVSDDFDRVRFFHATFREYLAASHAWSRRKEEALAARVGEARWQQVIALAVTRPGLLEPFVRALHKLERLGEREAQALLADCLRDADVWQPDPFVEVLDDYLAQRAAVARWRPPSWWDRLRGADPRAPEVSRALAAAAAAVLTLLRGRDIAAVRERASRLVADDDAAVREAARAFVAPAGDAAAERLVEERTGMVLLWVPPGRFVMGSGDDDPAAWNDEKPAREVAMAEGFFLGQHPVTNADYERFVKATGHGAPDAWRRQGFNDPAQPVTGVDFDDAVAFCAWLSTAPAWGARGLRAALPTEAEWEYAARGADGRRYPWGDAAPTPAHAVYGGAMLAKVGEHPSGRAPFGHEDMAGNVWEWTESVWQVGDNPVETMTNGAPRVVRGGAWSDLARYLRCATRGRYRPRDRSRDLGFRVVVRVSRQPR